MIKRFSKTYEKTNENTRRFLCWRGIIAIHQDLEAALSKINESPNEEEVCPRWDYATSSRDIAISLFRTYKKQLQEAGCFNKGYENAFQRTLKGEKITMKELINYRPQFSGVRLK